MAQIKVSVLIPLYSAERYIGNVAAHFSRIQSSDVEFVLADQHCFDDAASRLEDLAADDIRVRVFQTTDALRWWENYNFLLERARGEYVIILAQDDRLPHDWFAKVVGELDANPEAVAAYGPVEVIDDRDIVSMPHNNMAKHPEVFGQRWRVLSALLYFAGIAYPGAKLGLVRRRVLVDGALSIPETAGHTGLSTFIWFFAILLRGPILFHPELLVQRRVHPLSYTSRQATFGIGSQLARLFSYWSEGTSSGLDITARIRSTGGLAPFCCLHARSSFCQRSGCLSGLPLG